MNLTFERVREDHFWRGFATFVTGVAGASALIGIFASTEDAGTKVAAFLIGVLFVGLAFFTFIVTKGWSDYEGLPYPQKAACWLTVLIGWLCIFAVILLVVFVIFLGKAAARAVQESVFKQ